MEVMWKTMENLTLWMVTLTDQTQKKKTNEFFVQHLKIDASGASGNKIFGKSLVFVFEPDITAL